MPAEEETTAVTVSATMPDSAIVNEPRKVETEKSPIAETIEKNTETTENEGKYEEEKNTNVVEQKESKSKDDENKENVRENRNGTKASDENKTDAAKTSNAEAAGQTGGAVLRKRRTPEKKESTDEDVSPPKKVK